MSKFWTLYIGFTLAYIILVFIPSLAMILVVKNKCIRDPKGMVKIEVWMTKQKTVFGICFLDKISRS